MHKTRLAAATLITLLAAAPSAAGATNQTTRRPAPVALASSSAACFWGTVPCDDRLKIVTQQSVPSTIVQHDADAWVDVLDSPAGANNLTAPAASYTSCTVHLGRHRWPTRSSMIQDWDMLCMTMTHEFGHLLGHPHNTAPGSVTNPVFTNYSSEPLLCRRDRPTGSGPPA